MIGSRPSSSTTARAAATSKVTASTEPSVQA
jgi:hypothetical protein